MQNDVDQLGEIERGIQALGGFDDNRKFRDRAATLATEEREISVAAHQAQPFEFLSAQWRCCENFESPVALAFRAENPRRILPINEFTGGLEAQRVVARRVGGRQFAVFGQHRRHFRVVAPDAHAADAILLRQQFGELCGERSRWRFGLNRAQRSVEALQRRGASLFTHARSAHAPLPRYWITSRVMSSDCGAPPVNNCTPWRINSASSSTFSPAKS